MDDLISRQAAIDALACLDDYEEEAIEALRKLPSAQPDVPDTNVGDMVSRQAAIDAIEEYADRLQMVNWKVRADMRGEANDTEIN